MFSITTAARKKRRRSVRVWLVRNCLYVGLTVIILLSVGVGAIGCLGFVSTEHPSRPTVSTTTVAPSESVTQSETIISIVETTPTITEPKKPYYFDVPLSDEIQDYIREKCEEYDVAMELVIAMIEHESSFRADVISKTNDYGYMQINTINHEWLSETLGVTNFLDPYENILCGIYIISGHLEKTDGNIELALMRYNCGATGARRLWEQGIYSTSYSRSIMTLYESYKEKAANGAVTP